MLKIILAVPAFIALSTLPANAADFSPAEICKATISVEMGRPTKSMKTESSSSYPVIFYKRPDGDAFKYRCQVSEDRVIWSTFLTDTGEWGRWRNQYSEGDASTTYSVKNGVLTISNDQSGDHTFKRKDF
ncbi:hypothetical protein [Pseudomonas syringae]|uniref:hypothetical protein n=1 Tax=Pseudomonas syringae TaxID=317 RepID=UPI001F082372|nr:hypothetical protein [Pseudomonas syringae]